MRQNLTDFVLNRSEILTECEKKIFFYALLDFARSDASSMEMLQLSETVKTKLCSYEFDVMMRNDNTYARNIADLILVGVSKTNNMSKQLLHIREKQAKRQRTRKIEKIEVLQRQWYMCEFLHDPQLSQSIMQMNSWQLTSKKYWYRFSGRYREL